MLGSVTMEEVMVLEEVPAEEDASDSVESSHVVPKQKVTMNVSVTEDYMR